MVGFLRHCAALFFGLATINWLARNAEPSAARRAIVFGDVMAFGLAAILDVLSVFRGAGVAGLVPATVNLAIAMAFVLGRGAGLTAARSTPSVGSRS